MRRWTVFAFCTLLAILLNSAPAAAQLRATTISPAQIRQAIEAGIDPSELIMMQDGSDPSRMSQPGSDGPVPDSPEALEQQKQQLLQSLEFDRRPSTILRLWAAPKTPETPAPATPQPAPANPDPPTPPTPTPDPSATPDPAAAARAAAAAKARSDFLQFRTALTALQRGVTQGDWPSVRSTLQTFSETDRERVYDRLLQSLQQGPASAPKNRMGQVIGEKNLIRAADLAEIAELCPATTLSKARSSQLGALAANASQEGESATALAETFRARLQPDTPGRRLTPEVAANILRTAGRLEDCLSFLPPLATSIAAADLRNLDLQSQVLVSLHQRKPDRQKLEQAWAAVQAILEVPPQPPAPTAPSAPETPPATPATTPDAAPAGTPQPLTAAEQDQIQQSALRRAVLLVPQLRKELGQKWLADSFTGEPERGRRILTGIGSAAARNMGEQAQDPDERLQTLLLQQTAVEALLTQAADSTETWRPVLHLLLVNWLREASYSAEWDASTSRGPRMQRDQFGNFFWQQDPAEQMRQMQMQTGMPRPIPSGKLLDARPNDRWLAFLEAGFVPTFAAASARLHLKVKEETLAFPWIEQLAKTHPAEARELVETFLSTWSENNDPNNERRRTNPYMFSFGYNERLNAIPLTRSQQKRNLQELAEWVRRIRALKLDGVNEEWLATAFTKVHSAAEVYQQQDLEAVFGDLQLVRPETLALILNGMRSALSTVWRDPQVQQAAGTNRKKAEIEAEVLRGYQSALGLCATALAQQPHSWQLLSVRGALLHDVNNYQNDLAKSPEFIERRREALTALQAAATAYSETVQELDEKKYSVTAFNTWFYAALGDASLERITEERVAIPEQIPLIAQALQNLPGEVRERHLDMFANDLFTRMSTVNPSVKFRYVREGLKLAGDRPQAREARQVFDYYRDLVTEIQLQTAVDGTVRVGHSSPFGVLVSLRHSAAIERESGGFSRYLQNQNSGGGYFYNNGRPNEDYRDKFEKAARAALDEHFEVLSVTFEPESIQSRPDPEAGWRVTPYAYLLLKARGPEIDRLPPVRIDLDFLDTTGYVVLPVESPAIPLDCAPSTGDPRPIEDLTLTQTLDEREAASGKLLLEIKAVGRGLVPELEQLVELQFADFEVAGIEDNKLSVSKFDDAAREPAVLSERLWTVSLKDRRERTADDARTFHFATARIEPKELLFQRFNDADLESVEQTLTLRQSYDQPTSHLAAWILGFLLATTAAGALWYLRRRQPETAPTAGPRWQVPSDITPFSALTLLRDIQQKSSLPGSAASDLASSIERIERWYFATSTPPAPQPDLRSEVTTWIERAAP
ncbi:MAG: hypothetical protein ACKO2P_14610 [Planctomycetota bacterium]